MTTSTIHSKPETSRPLDLMKWRKAPWILITIGGIGAVAEALANPVQFGHSWLVAFMFYLSLSLGAMFLVMMHHLFDAGWSAPIRRYLEHLACLSFPALLALFLPIAALSQVIYPWLRPTTGERPTLSPSSPLFSSLGFYAGVVLCFGAWAFISNRLRTWSLKQDQTGGVDCARRMRFYSATGIFLFGFTLTLASVVWMKSLFQQWFSTIYGVWYFAGSVWATLALAYLLLSLLQRTGPLRGVVRQEQYYLLGSLLLAFTIFYAYIGFSQYFVIWNANLPEETSWYVARERGGWWWVGMVIVFGHFALPFLMLLRIDWKLKLSVMGPLCLWALLMHFCDLQFQIMPGLHPNGPALQSLLADLVCMGFIGGVLAEVFLRSFQKHPPFPQRDPRLAEALGIHAPSTTRIAIAPERAKMEGIAPSIPSLCPGNDGALPSK